MITITNLKKKYGDTYILKGISLEFPRTGIVAIYGPSGCGKSTFLNCLSGLAKYEGNIAVDSVSLENMNEKQQSDFRLRNYGFIFQDYKLFENETALNNILFPLKTITNLSKEKLMRKCNDILELLNLNISLNIAVKKVSGGEKQRICIARALINDPKIILADEPTGALDIENGEIIMGILSKISKSTLVILVSHDRTLTEKYADEIIELKDGQVINILNKSAERKEESLPIIQNNKYSIRQKIPIDFLFKHSIHSIKERKWRTVFCNLTTSIGLIGVGLAISLSSNISSAIKNSYSSLLKESSLIISLPKTAASIYGEYAGSYYEAQEIKEKYKDCVIDIGVNYIANFESFFPDSNKLIIKNGERTFPIDGISIRNVNEFEWLDCSEGTFYPRKPILLEDDQIVLGLTIDMVRDICFNLRIERTITSLSRYLNTNDLFAYFDLRNDSWEYSDEQIFKIVGFTLKNNPCIYHLNRLWNQFVFEECMRFPTVDNFVEEKTAPWIMKKIPYFYVNENIDYFLSSLSYDPLGDGYIFEIANATYYPWMFLNKSVNEIRRIMFFSNRLAHIPNRYTNYFSELSNNLGKPIFTNQLGYSAYGSSLMVGFSKPMYFCLSSEKLNTTLEELSIVDNEANESINMPEDILVGHFSKKAQNGVDFKIIAGFLKEGREPSNYDEIAVSSGMLASLNGQLGDTISIAYTFDQKTTDSGKYLTDFRIVNVKIVGIIEDENNYIYHDNYWTIGFFQTRLGISSFNLQTTSILYEVLDDKKIEETIKDLKKGFPDYEIYNPMSEVNESINEVCGYISFALVIFSSVSALISIILLTISNHLHILETREEIALARCIGANKKEAKKFVLSYSVIMCLISFSLSSFELFGINVITSLEISKIITKTNSISFNPLSLLAMFILSLTVSLISSLLISRKINKLNPIDALKR